MTSTQILPQNPTLHRRLLTAPASLIMSRNHRTKILQRMAGSIVMGPLRPEARDRAGSPSSQSLVKRHLGYQQLAWPRPSHPPSRFSTTMFQPGIQFIQSGARHRAGLPLNLLRIPTGIQKTVALIIQPRQPCAQCRHSCTKASEILNRRQPHQSRLRLTLRRRRRRRVANQTGRASNRTPRHRPPDRRRRQSPLLLVPRRKNSRAQPHFGAPSAVMKVKEGTPRLKKTLRMKRRKRSQSDQRTRSKAADIPKSQTQRTQRAYSGPKTCATSASSFSALLSASILAWPW